MIYLPDTHAIVWYLEGDSHLSQTARQILQDDSLEFIVPTIVLAEAAHLFERARSTQSMESIVASFVDVRNCALIDLTLAILRGFPQGLEMHDAIVCATAQSVSAERDEPVTVITKDKRIVTSRLVHSIW